MVRVKRRASKETRQPVELAEAIRRSLSTEKITQRPPMARIKKTHLRSANVVPVDRRRDWPEWARNIKNVHGNKWPHKFRTETLVAKKVRIYFVKPNPRIKYNGHILKGADDYTKFMKSKTWDQLFLSGRKKPLYDLGHIKHDIRNGYLAFHPGDLKDAWEEFTRMYGPEQNFLDYSKKERDAPQKQKKAVYINGTGHTGPSEFCATSI